MNLRLSSPITEINGIGPAKAKLFKKLDIVYVRDLLYTFPRRYEDFSNIQPISALEVGQIMTVKGKVKSLESNWGFQGKRRLLRIFVDIEDETGILHATWYNLRFLEKQLIIGREIYVAGTVEATRKMTEGGERKEFSMRSPALEFVQYNGDQTHTARITPIYPETHGISSRFIRYQVKNLLPILQTLPEYIPAKIIKQNDLMGIHEAIKVIHFPDSHEQREIAEKRLRFDELFFLQLAALVRRARLKKAKATPITFNAIYIKGFIKKLPFSLTGAQERALQDIEKDLKQSHPMNRLLQGDVGSGKSAVALVAAAGVLKAGRKVLDLAPTEILARQQAASFATSLGKEHVSLLIGALTATEKKRVKDYIAGETAHCVIGTHALLQDDIIGKDIGLVIIDEQHRFGVAQRQALKKLEAGQEPHLLSMTATPIPRTLNLTVYGDLDVSVLDEMPPGRKAIETVVVPPDEREPAIIHMLEQLHSGRQGYVIAPLVEGSDKVEAKSAKEAYEEMTHLFPGIAVGLVHGQMKSEEKERIMGLFNEGAIQLLVSTAVVEVGVNVPNATVMIIEGAERFGLAQLHQFRGRIGRGEHQSHCYIFPTTKTGAKSRRLGILASTNDGFKIAEEDLKLRGPGEVYGIAQSGFSDLKVASLLDYPTIKQARDEAEKILKKDPDLDEYPILKAKVAQKNMINHFE